MENVRHMENSAKDKLKDIAEQTEQYIKAGEKKLKKFVHTADQQLHENPWPIVAGVAAVSLLLGFVMGISRRGGRE